MQRQQKQKRQAQQANQAYALILQAQQRQAFQRMEADRLYALYLEEEAGPVAAMGAVAAAPGNNGQQWQQAPAQWLDPNFMQPKKQASLKQTRDRYPTSRMVLPHIELDTECFCGDPLEENVVLVRHEGENNIVETEAIGHYLHKQCLTTWLRSNVGCPMCREQVVELIPMKSHTTPRDVISIDD
jgi:hypothetical protein